MIKIIDLMCQVGIGVGAPLSIFLLGKHKRIGFVVNLAIQPCFIGTALINHQPGVMIASVLYSLSLLYSIRKSYVINADKWNI